MTSHQQKYEQTAKGRAARQRSRNNWNAKRRERRAAARNAAAPEFSAQELAQVLSAWNGDFDLGATHAAQQS